MKKYDLVVIGSGPAGEKAAVKAAYFGHKVAVIERAGVLGGAGINTGTLPSKTLKETALYLSGKYEKGLFGVDRALEHEASVKDFLYRKDLVCSQARQEVAENIRMHGVDLFEGTAVFADAHKIRVQGDVEEVIYGEHIIIATGSYPFHPEGIPFDEKRVHDSDTILGITRFPDSICVLGAGVIGCEYATIFATMGCRVYLVNRTDKILGHVDNEVIDAFMTQMKAAGVEILFNASVESIEVPEDEKEALHIQLQDGKRLNTDMFLFAAGRSGNIADLNLEAAGVQTGKRETIVVDETYRTNVPHIYAVGDVIGFPALASTSMDQGRVAVAHIFQTHDLEHISKIIPYGIYTVPEISMVGLTEEDARDKGIDYVVGRAYHKNMRRGQIMGAKSGMLKIIFNRQDLKVVGVHIIGHLAAELIHYGTLVVQDEKTVMDVIAAVFNAPTLHDLYKYACYDGLSELTGKHVK